MKTNQTLRIPNLPTSKLPTKPLLRSTTLITVLKMKQPIKIAITLAIAVITGIVCVSVLSTQQTSRTDQTELVLDGTSQVVSADYQVGQETDGIQLCQGFGHAAPQQYSCQDGNCGVASQPVGLINQLGFGKTSKPLAGVDDSTRRLGNLEPRWRAGGDVPFEEFGYGEWIGPHRTPHVGQYRLRVGDDLEFVYIRTREKSLYPYQLYVGDTIEVSSAIDESLNQIDLIIRSDGKTTFSLIGQVMCAGKTVEGLQRELNDRYTEYVREPNIVVQVRSGDTPLSDIIDSVDARQGQGGQARETTVSPDGTIQLPGVGSVPAVGLTLEEIGREVNARYRLRLGGIEVTPILQEISPRFIYVLGEVGTAGQFQLTGPTTALQALALAQGDNPGGNLRQIIVMRRDQNWRLTATKLDLAGAVYGKRPQPSDDIWLRDNDIVLVPRKPIQRLSEAVNLYLSNTLFQIFPQQGGAFNFDDFTPL